MEQWEIDLRNQLAGSPQQSQPESPRHNPVRNQPQQTKVVVRNGKKEQGDRRTVLAVVAVSLCLLLLFAVNLKSGGMLWSSKSESIVIGENPSPSRPSPVTPPSIGQPSDPHLSSLRQEVDALKARDQEIVEKLTQSDRRVAFLGMLHNNNFVVLKNNYDKKDLVFLNEDWTIDQMPKYLNLSSADQEYLRRFIRE